MSPKSFPLVSTFLVVAWAQTHHSLSLSLSLCLCLSLSRKGISFSLSHTQCTHKHTHTPTHKMFFFKKRKSTANGCKSRFRALPSVKVPVTAGSDRGTVKPETGRESSVCIHPTCYQGFCCALQALSYSGKDGCLAASGTWES